MQPKFSIITVCYQAEDCIKKTLLSVIEQTYPEIEHIIVDGASTDHTLEIVNALSTHAKVLSEPDNGIYDAMNKGLSMATGDYVWFLNAGDTFDSEYTVQRVAECCMEYGSMSEQWPDVLYGDTRIVDDQDRDMGLRRLRPPKRLTWKSFKNGMLVCHQAFVARREIAPSYDLSYRFSADFDWCIRILKKSRLVVDTDQDLANYLNMGTTKRNHKASLMERFRIMRKYYGLFTTLFRHFTFIFIRTR